MDKYYLFKHYLQNGVTYIIEIQLKQLFRN
jgi:hypothetical protein